MTTQDKSREAFEAWFRFEGLVRNISYHDSSDGFEAGVAYGRAEQATEIAQTQTDIERALYALTESETETDKLKAEIAQLKAQLAEMKETISSQLDTQHSQQDLLAEVMPLAKFGAMTIGSDIQAYHHIETISHAIAAGIIVDDEGHGDPLNDTKYADGIEATITKLLKD
jgi:uncharacterized small protein (DUF1192 family)